MAAAPKASFTIDADHGTRVITITEAGHLTSRTISDIDTRLRAMLEFGRASTCSWKRPPSSASTRRVRRHEQVCNRCDRPVRLRPRTLVRGGNELARGARRRVLGQARRSGVVEGTHQGQCGGTSGVILASVLRQTGVAQPTNAYGQDRRRERRFRVLAPACIRLRSGNIEPANVVNVSASGVMLHAPVALPDTCGAHVQVEFLGNVSRGVVRHVSGAPYGRFVGIEFDSEPK